MSKSIYDELDKQLADLGVNPILEYDDPPRIRTGSVSLDLITGGGIPRSRMTNIYGEESCGKSTVCQLIASTITQNPDTMKNNGLVLFVDTEHAYSLNWANKIGIDGRRIRLLQPNSGEEALDAVYKVIKANIFDLVVFDSIAATPFNAELEGAMDDNHVGVGARKWNMFYRKIRPALNQSDTAFITINQPRQKIGVLFGNPETQPGGRGRKFVQDIEIRMNKPERLPKDAKSPQIGIKFNPTIKKNKTAESGRSEYIMLRTETGYFGVDRIAELIHIGKKMDVFTKEDGTAISGSCAWFFGEENLGVGQGKALQSLKSNADLAQRVEDEIYTMIESLNKSAVGGIDE